MDRLRADEPALEDRFRDDRFPEVGDGDGAAAAKSRPDADPAGAPVGRRRARARGAAPAAASGFPAPMIGELVGMTEGAPLVLLRTLGKRTAVRARATVDLLPEHVGSDVLVMLADGDPARPIVIGRLRPEGSQVPPGLPVEVEVDGGQVVVTASERLVLRCGLACITLTRAGKVLIEGQYVSSRSAGVHRINGGSVQIN